MCMFEPVVIYRCIFFFNDTATTEIYTLSLHDALPISIPWSSITCRRRRCCGKRRWSSPMPASTRSSKASPARSEEHTSELQSRQYLVCRLLLEKNKTVKSDPRHTRVRQ